MGNDVHGFANQASGAFSGNDVYGANNQASGTGAGNNVSGYNDIAIGTGAGNNVYANNTIAIGTNANAQGNNGIAVGANSYAAGQNDMALGENAQVLADHSTAIGADAVATKDHQMVFGTTGDTYTTPGITSGKSKSRQSGPLEVVTSDAGGNLATDGGSIFNQLNRLNRRSSDAFAGVALALAANGPDLTGNERFGVSANYGNFEGSNAFGMGFEGVLRL